MPLLKMQTLTPGMWSPGRGSRSASTSSTSPSWTTRMPSSPSQPWRWEHMTSTIQALYKNNKRDSYNGYNSMTWFDCLFQVLRGYLVYQLCSIGPIVENNDKVRTHYLVTVWLVRKQNDKSSHQTRCQCPSLTNSNMSWVQAMSSRWWLLSSPSMFVWLIWRFFGDQFYHFVVERRNCKLISDTYSLTQKNSPHCPNGRTKVWNTAKRGEIAPMLRRSMRFLPFQNVSW